MFQIWNVSRGKQFAYFFQMFCFGPVFLLPGAFAYLLAIDAFRAEMHIPAEWDSFLMISAAAHIGITMMHSNTPATGMIN